MLPVLKVVKNNKKLFEAYSFVCGIYLNIHKENDWKERKFDTYKERL